MWPAPEYGAVQCPAQPLPFLPSTVLQKGKNNRGKKKNPTFLENFNKYFQFCCPWNTSKEKILGPLCGLLYPLDFSSTSSYISANQITPPVYLSPERWHWQPRLISACQEPAPSSGVGQELHRSYLEWEKECKSGKALLPVLPSSAACSGQCREAEVRGAQGDGGCLLPVD